MRFVNRHPCPADLDGPSSPGGAETTLAIAHFAVGSRSREQAFSFTAYKGDTVRDALRAMFHGKCAYCESFYASTSPMDIEHYRPKGAISTPSGGRLMPGYYWLAAEWSNLLPSCPDCNRKRRHSSPGGTRTSGKADAFPLADESQRARVPGGEVHEVPLLLNPCVDDPDEHLEFEGFRIQSVIVDGVESIRGRATITCLGLDRRTLEADREDRLIVVDTAIRHYRESVEDVDADPSNAKLRDRLARNAQDLLAHLRPQARYSAMARQRVLSEIPDLLPPSMRRRVLQDVTGANAGP